GCHAHKSDAELRDELLRLRSDELPNDHELQVFVQRHDVTAVLMGHHTTASSGVGLYAWAGGKVRMRIHVTSEGTALEKQLHLLNAEIFRPRGAAEPLLVVANTHPWYASCWRTLRFRVLAPGATPRTPRALLDRETSGRWCEGVKIEIAADEVRFRYEDWGLAANAMQRVHTLAYRIRNGVLERRFGFTEDSGLV